MFCVSTLSRTSPNQLGCSDSELSPEQGALPLLSTSIFLHKHFFYWSYQHLSSVTQDVLFILLQSGICFLPVMGVQIDVVHKLKGWRRMTRTSQLEGLMVVPHQAGSSADQVSHHTHYKFGRGPWTAVMVQWWISPYHGADPSSSPSQCIPLSRPYFPAAHFPFEGINIVLSGFLCFVPCPVV